jgi:phospholipid-binding lipoprotein MlaA
MGAKSILKVLACLFPILLLAACAHRGLAPAGAGLTAPPTAGVAKAQEVQTASTAQPKTTGSEQGKDNLDFLEEEAEEPVVVAVADPLAPFNRAMFVFNDRFYFWALKPAAQGYKAVVPVEFRAAIQNFFHNLSTPLRAVSCLLQGRGKDAGVEIGRFLINSTVGVLGFGDPAQDVWHLTPREEDLGQALASYGLGHGFYIVWPIFGPSSFRDTFGLIGGWFLQPITYVKPPEASLELNGFSLVNETSFRIGDYESIKNAAIDPYVSFRNAYIQNRQKKVNE